PCSPAAYAAVRSATSAKVNRVVLPSAASNVHAGRSGQVAAACSTAATRSVGSCAERISATDELRARAVALAREGGEDGVVDLAGQRLAEGRVEALVEDLLGQADRQRG